MVAWVGLRGAVPIVLATWPRLVGVQGSERIFDLVFFVALTSVIVQGTTLPALVISQQKLDEKYGFRIEWVRLDQAALDAVRQWRFVPARQGEQAVAAWVLVPIQFALEN